MSDAGGALEHVKEAFQGKRGKILLIGGGVAIAGYVWWTRRNGTPQAVPDTSTTDTTGTTDTGTSPQTDPTVGNTSTGTTSTGARKYANNADWLADGTSFLQGRGTPASDAYNALTLALGGLPITAQQSAWVSQVIGALGAPPEGMPPLNAAAPAPTGSTQGNTTLGAISGRVTTFQRTAIAQTWKAAANAVKYQVLLDGRLITEVSGTSYTVSGLKPNTHHTVGIRPVGATGNLGSTSNTTGYTKK